MEVLVLVVGAFVIFFLSRSRRVYMPPSTKGVLNTEYGRLAARVARIETELGLDPFPFQAGEEIPAAPETQTPPVTAEVAESLSEIDRHEFRSDLPPRA